MADALTSGDSPSSQIGILALLLQMMKAQSGESSPSGSTTAKSSKDSTTSFPNDLRSSIPKSDASDQYLQDWYAANHGRTVYGPDGNSSMIPAMNSESSQGGSYGKASGDWIGSPEPGTIRGWIDQDKGILKGASFQNPLIAKAEAMLKDLQGKDVTPATLGPAPKAVPVPPTTMSVPAYNPANTGLISGMMTSQPSTPTVPPSTPSITDMIGANASQAANNPNLQASSAQLAGTRTDTAFPRMSSASYIPDQWSHLANSIGSYSGPVNTNALGRSSQDMSNPVSLGSLGSTQAAPMGLGGANYAQGGLDAASGVSAPALGAGGANYAAGGLDGMQGGLGATGGAASGGGLSAGQAGALASGISGIFKGIGQMFTPGTVGIPNLPQGVPLSKFSPPMMT